ncbi:hypothetical protein D3C76_1441660 [compost metagenome]
MRNAIPKFSKSKVNLSDRTDKDFNNDLNDEEILILGNLMIIEYLKPQIISLENIKQSISSKNFVLTSQANFLQSLLTLRDTIKSEVNKLILDYTYNNGKVNELR